MRNFQDRILLGAMALLVIAITVVVISSFNQRNRINSIASRVEHTRQVLLDLSAFYNKVLEHAGSARSYALSNDQPSISLMQETASSLNNQFNSLRDLVKKTKEHTLLLDSLSFYLDKRVDLSNQIIDEGRTNGIDAASALYQTGLGREYNNQLFSFINQMQANELSSLQQLEQESVAGYKKLSNYLLGLLVTILGLMIIIIQKIRLDFRTKKLKEEELKDFNERLQTEVKAKTHELITVFERITDGFLAIDKNFRLTYVNRKALEITEAKSVNLIGKHVQEVFPDIITTQFYTKLKEAVEFQKYHYQQEYFPRFLKWFESHVYPSPEGVSIFFSDITERKQAEEEKEKITVQLIKEKALSESVINSLPGVFFVRSEESKLLRWNKILEEVTGYSHEEIPNIDTLEFFVESERGKVRKSIEEVYETGKASVEAIAKTKSGDQIPFYFTSQLIEYGGKKCIIGTGIDITQMKKMEEDLRVSEQKYKLLFESNPMPMWIFDRNDFNVIDVNESAVRHYGYTRDEFLTMNMLDLRPPEDIPRFLESIKQPASIKAQQGIWRHIKKDRSIIYVEVIGHDIMYEGKTVRLALGNDVTEKIEAEENLLHSYKEIRLLTRHLHNVREEERAHIAREIHDELGQQLTVLKMDASWLDKKLMAANDSIRQKVKGLIELLDGTVKSVRRISSELRPSLLDDLGLVAAIEWHLQEFRKRSDIKTAFKYDIEELNLSSETSIGLFRIFQESLTNVARHSNAKNVKVSLQLVNDSLELSIEDDGIGFDRSVAATKKTLGILGMEERSSMMGGKYIISSKPGAGTRVLVCVPYEIEITK